MSSSYRFLACLIFMVTAPTLAADQQPIAIDGQYQDWAAVAPIYVDTLGDDGSSGIDFGNLWLADDDQYLFLRFDLGVEIELDFGNDLVIYIDGDSNAATGFSTSSIGAELAWRPGDRNGTFYHSSGNSTVYHDNVGFIAMPTVTANVFEMRFAKDALPDDSNALFDGGPIRIAVRDQGSGGDRIPNSGSTINYTFGVGVLPPSTVTPFEREFPSDLRIASHNVRFDSPWDSGQEPRFGRQYATIDADIYNLQEIYDFSASETQQLVANWVAPLPGDSWYSASNADCKTVSRYPIINSWGLSGNLAVLIDTTSVLGSEILIINAHLPCCANDSGRQDEIDEILEFLREAKLPGGLLTLNTDTPILLTGDMNLVTLSQHRTSLTDGEIMDQTTYGSSFNPDWDNTALTNLITWQQVDRTNYTWRSDTSSFWPGQLDFHIYSDSVLEVGRHYLLHTPGLPAGMLAASGMQSSDSLASDHLLYVADYRAPGTQGTGSDFVRGDCNDDGGLNIADAIRQLIILFEGTVTANCESACDSNDDGQFDLSDPVALLNYVFESSSSPPPPFGSCGIDPSSDALTCNSFSSCP